MKNLEKKMLRTILFYNFAFMIIITIFYFAIPILLNYPPNSINNEFETTIDMGMKYIEQYSIIVGAVLLISNILLLIQFKKVENCENIKSDEAKYKKILKTCFGGPGKLYFIHAFVPPIFIFGILLLTGAGMLLTIKISVCMLAVFMALGLLIYVLSKNIFNDVLTKINNDRKIRMAYNITTYRERMFLQFLPLVILMGAFMYLASMSAHLNEKSELMFEKYLSKLDNIVEYSDYSLESIIDNFKTISKENDEDTFFVINKDGELYKDSDGIISDFFIKYTFNVDNPNHTYDYFSSDIYGVYKIVNINSEKCAVGIMYNINHNSEYMLVWITFLILLFVSILFLIFFAADFSRPINKVSNYMNKLSDGASVDYNKKLPVVSNDEIGDLTVNFNKILDLEKSYVETIKQNQDMLVENERLSSLGQLIGGIAHSLKTPIMSVSGHLVALERLADEYEQSIGNPSVTAEDYHEITAEMKDWINKSKEYMSYMTEVINAAKGQAVSMNANTIGSFSMKELVMRTQILMKEELTKYNCNLDVKLNIAEETEIRGELSALVQVLDNLISNAMQAYDGKEGKIIVSADEDQDKVYIKIQDFAGGIPEHIKDKLFKEMITTKGKNGTGLGLYMCYSTIKGKFNGDLRFESETGVGTTFFITLNKVK